MDHQFPAGFLWGAATAAYQVEGFNKNSDWWEIEEKIEPEIAKSGGADDYNRFREDYSLASNLFLNAQRLSLEWSRIEPREGAFDRKEIDHYKSVLSFLKERSVKVFLTLHHFSNPIWFEEKGGWFNRSFSRFVFGRYVQLCVEELSSFVDSIITINEPNLYSGIYPLKTYLRDGRQPLLTAFRTFWHLLSIHTESYKLIKKMQPELPVGLAMNFAWIDPSDHSPLSRFASFLANYFGLRPLKEVLAKYSDFIGVNYYFHLKARLRPWQLRNFFELYNGEAILFSHGFGGSKARFDLSEVNRGESFSDLGWETYPLGLYEVVRNLKDLKKPIYITENGIADESDQKRGRYIKEHLREISKLIGEGVDVRGYFYWSLIDNFEWFLGYKPRFGLIDVDYKTKERRIRPSALEFSRICQSNLLDS